MLTPGGSSTHLHPNNTWTTQSTPKIHITIQLIRGTTQLRKSAGLAPSLRGIPWHLPYNWGKSTEEPLVNTKEKKYADVGTSVPWAGFERVIPLSTHKAPWSPRLWSEFGIIKEVFSYSCLRFLWSSSARIVQCLCTTHMTNTGNILLWPSHFSLLWSAMQSSDSPKSDWWLYFVKRQTICI